MLNSTAPVCFVWQGLVTKSPKSRPKDISFRKIRLFFIHFDGVFFFAFISGPTACRSLCVIGENNQPALKTLSSRPTGKMVLSLIGKISRISICPSSGCESQFPPACDRRNISACLSCLLPIGTLPLHLFRYFVAQNGDPPVYFYQSGLDKPVSLSPAAVIRRAQIFVYPHYCIYI